MSNGTTLNLYLISQTVNHDYDTFDSAVVAAYDEEDAKSIHPISSWYEMDPTLIVTPTASEVEEEKEKEGEDYIYDHTWTTREHVKVEFLGEAADNIKRGVICASYHAG